MGNGNGVSRGDRNRNARLGWGVSRILDSFSVVDHAAVAAVR